MTDEQRLQMITEQLILVRDNLFRGMSKSIQKLQARSINEVLELPNHTQSPPAQQEPVGCEGAIVNGRVYADRLEHDYKFECEAGPLHLCTDWVEFRRCFEWLAQHTSPPAQRKPLPDFSPIFGDIKEKNT